MGKRFAAWLVFAALAAAAGSAARAATIVAASPRGDVAEVRQVSVRFSDAVAAIGDARQPDPMVVRCTGAAVSGEGRWADDRLWLYDFREPLPPGVRCTVRIRPGWKPIAGTITGTAEFAFATGGPAVVATQPWSGATITEDQHFLLRLAGPARSESVLVNARCEVEGLGETIPVRIVDGAPRDAVLKARGLTREAARWLMLACQRPFASEARVRLVWGKGIASVGDAGLVTTVEQRFEFQVRRAFLAEFSCARERAGAPCLPIRPLVVRFSEPVARALAEAVRLRPARGDAIAPTFDPDDRATEVAEVRFPVPLPENADFTVELPRDLRDGAGRALANMASFPLRVATGDAPPIAKFAAAPFGIVEWTSDAALPVTLRHVQGDLRSAAAGGSVRLLRVDGDAPVLDWIRRLRRLHEARLPARELGLPEREWTELRTETGADGRAVRRRVERLVHAREVPLLEREPQAKRLDLPALAGGDPRPFEVVGIPLAQPGFHVVEIASRRLGGALLGRDAPMFVRTGVLVTNLGVHFKRGRENALVWVTTLDRAKPVAGAEVAINGCDGRRLWAGRTDASGLARAPVALDEPGPDCDDGYFVSARAAGADGVEDTAFVFSGWQRGIEAWRFGHATGRGAEPDAVAHTVFDRTLLRAGETVSMKHFLRLETGDGLALPQPPRLPTRMRIVHEGSGQEYEQALRWNGARHAVSTWAIPGSARLGRYRVVLVRDAPAGARAGDDAAATAREWPSGAFRVEQFRVPLIDARLAPPRDALVAPSEVAIGVQLNHLSGGGVAAAPLRATALLRERIPSFVGYDEFSFAPPRDPQAGRDDDEGVLPDREVGGGRVVADKLMLATDRAGAATFAVRELPPIVRAGRLETEVSFADPSGEVQTVATAVDVWPAAVVPAIRPGAWASARGGFRFSALALDVQGRPVANQTLEVRARVLRTVSHRKRLVGGFYAYDNRTEVDELGVLCSGKSDARGLLPCEATLAAAGQVELVVAARDAAGRRAEAAATIWITRGDDLWFAQGDDDRIELVPDKRRVEPGETARLQVRMPYREATALVTVEREGIVSSEVVTLSGIDPSVKVRIEPGHAPNVYVSVLALRGRVRELSWTSFFRWGWRNPVHWLRAWWVESRDYRPPTAMVDLAKPSFRLGVAALEVGLAAHELEVRVSTDRAEVPVRGTAIARIRVTHGGLPLAAGEAPEVAFAAVDEGLLALRPNDSWDLLHGLVRQRAWGVETSTAQGEIVGRRHYGRKAVAAGGGGGRGATRELFDTLLLWKPVVALDANGEAVVEVPINDSLTRFRLVAIADAGRRGGVPRFGTGSTAIRVTQDLQILPGLPPLVREGDRFAAQLTLRNTTGRDMAVRATLAGTVGGDASVAPRAIALPPREVRIAAGASTEVSWPVEVPAGAASIAWEAAADEREGGATDRVRRSQRVAPAVPPAVLQATVARLDAALELPLEAPAGMARGRVEVSAQPRLSAALPGIRRFFETYPYTCLEQQASQAIGLGDAAAWRALADALPTHLDRDGLAAYFPQRAGDAAAGSDRLTAYLIAVADEAGLAWPEATREAMLGGLSAFVDGRIVRAGFAAPVGAPLDRDVRKLAAIEALSRHGRAEARMLGSIEIAPASWPTAALIDWLAILRRVPKVPDAARRSAEAQQLVRSRLAFSGTTLRFSTEEADRWWWLMDGPDANAARLVLALLDEPGWRAELPRLVVGALGRQQGGAWRTTTANAWGALALAKFGARFDAAPPAEARTTATLGAASAAIDWRSRPEGDAVSLPWPSGASRLALAQQGGGRPWVTVQAIGALPLERPFAAGYSITRALVPIEQRVPGQWSRGDIARVRIEIDAAADMTWVVLSDPVPAGATVLGSGLGRDALLATAGERREGFAWAAWEERSFDAFRAYYAVLPRGRHAVEYTVRFNSPGRFGLPPTRVEAMYAPEVHGVLPNAALEVAP